MIYLDMADVEIAHVCLVIEILLKVALNTIILTRSRKWVAHAGLLLSDH
jgi:hypothetical protein